jgi:hypothetical protein
MPENSSVFVLAISAASRVKKSLSGSGANGERLGAARKSQRKQKMPREFIV